MTELKLSRLPDRTPVKLSIQINPDLDRQLQAYAGAYKEAYGEDEKVADLIPYMLQEFLQADRKFSKHARSARRGKPTPAARKPSAA